eukprot:gene6885-18510_t
MDCDPDDLPDPQGSGRRHYCYFIDLPRSYTSADLGEMCNKYG